MVAREREMARVNAHPDCLGARSIVATLPEARIGFQCTSTNKTPSATARINALINYLWKKIPGNPSTDIDFAKLKEIRLGFRSITRRLRYAMTQEGAVATSWGTLSAQEKTYYALRLEREIFEYGYAIYKCNKKWAANLLIQECMKAERQGDKRRKVTSH